MRFAKLRAIRKFIPIMLALSLVAVSLIAITLVLLPTGEPMGDYTMTLTGMEIQYDSDIPTSVQIQLRPDFGTGVVMVVLNIENWREIREDSDLVEIYFPGSTFDHQLPGADSQKMEVIKFAPELHDREELLYSRRDVVRIRPKEIEDFAGAIVFLWRDGIIRTSFSKYALGIQFGPTVEAKVNHYTIVLQTSKKYAISSAIPQPSKTQFYATAQYSIFDFDPQTTDLYVHFEDASLLEKTDYFIVISSTLLGLSLAVLVQQVARIMQRTTEHVRKHQARTD